MRNKVVRAFSLSPETNRQINHLTKMANKYWVDDRAEGTKISHSQIVEYAVKKLWEEENEPKA